MEEEKMEKGFVVKDKRRFHEDGESRADETEPPGGKPASQSEKSQEAQQAEPEAHVAEEPFLPEMNFVNFILSLSTSVMFHLGDFPDPTTKKTERNLTAAKQTIDILGMLKEKTEGNLSHEEKSMLDAVLFELRMRYVKEKDNP
jgi:hypothetical protein